MGSLRKELGSRQAALAAVTQVAGKLDGKHVELRRGDEAVVLHAGRASGFQVLARFQGRAEHTVWLPEGPLASLVSLRDVTVEPSLGLGPADLLTLWSAVTGRDGGALEGAEVAVAARVGASGPRLPNPDSPLVTVVGAGVTGLSVAHELIERGFRVQVVDQHTYNVEPWKVAIGGMARTPLRRLPDPAGRARPVQVVDPIRVAAEGFDGRILVPRAGAPEYEAPAAARTALGNFLAAAVASKDPGGEPGERVWTVMVIGWLGETDDPGDTRERVKAVLTAMATVVPEGWELAPGAAAPEPAAPCAPGVRPTASRTIRAREVGVEGVAVSYRRGEDTVQVLWDPEVRVAADPYDRGDEQHAYIELRVRQFLVPTEHGYRVFPAFYRHLFDTMRRTPLLDEVGRPTGRTAYDNLVPTGEVQMYRFKERDPVKKSKLHSFPRRPARSFEELRKMIHEFRSMGFEDWDLALFEVRILKYLTSCADRRKAEAEGKDWKTYIGIDDFRRSPGENGFAEALEDAPLSLLAARADQVDARTHLNTAVQLFLDHLRTDRPSDQTLNGPTTSAWFEPWKRYLRYQGVQFYQGRLATIDLDGPADARTLNAGWASEPVADPGTAAFCAQADYHVLAADLYALFQLVKDKGLVGDLGVIDDWRVTAESEVRRAMGVQGLPEGGAYSADDYLRLGGVGPAGHQSWTPTGPFRVMAGVQYYFESGVRVGGEGHVYYIGAPWGVSSISQPAYWRTRMQRHEAGFVSNLSVDLCHWTNAEVAADTSLNAFWTSADGLQAETWRQITEPLPEFQRTRLALPTWYAVDWHLERAAAGHIQRNAAPYLINRPEDNEARPTWNRDPGAPEPETLRGAAPGLAYRMSYGNWVLAGTQMRTRTRLTSMEAANESARHAVNAILYDAAMRVEGRLLGEFCKTWDPEDDEFPDLSSLRRLDERLVARGLPHMLDILKVEAVITATPKSPLNLADYLEEAYDSLRDEPGVPRQSWDEWKQVSQRLTGWFREQLKSGG